MKKHLLFFLSLFLLFTGCVQAETKTLSLVSWNVQTFFDAETEGTEYSDYQSAARWSKDKYLVRLKRLCEVIKTLNADIFVLEEIENEAVLYDISNLLAGNSWKESNNWNYGCFAKDDYAAIGIGVISRYPLRDLKTHTMDIRVQKETQPSTRPLLQVTADINGFDLTIFAAHWKSKVGGEDESEIWRDWQEGVLANVMLKSIPAAAIVCGDFNRDAADFVVTFDGTVRGANTVLRAPTEFGADTVVVYNPWFDAYGSFSTDLGSYFFDNKWERIDQIFAYGKVKLSSFSPRAEEPWANGEGKPVGYKIFTGEGYSDHLPLMCSLLLTD